MVGEVDSAAIGVGGHCEGGSGAPSPIPGNWPSRSQMTMSGGWAASTRTTSRRSTVCAANRAAAQRRLSSGAGGSAIVGVEPAGEVEGSLAPPWAYLARRGRHLPTVVLY